MALNYDQTYQVCLGQLLFSTVFCFKLIIFTAQSIMWYVLTLKSSTRSNTGLFLPVILFRLVLAVHFQ